MNRKPSESAVDRLIALASDEKPGSKPDNGKGNAPTDLEAVPVFGEAALDLEHNPMWKALLQFRALLPYVSRLLDMSRGEPTPALTAELKHSVSELANSQRELRIVVQEQLVQMKHIEEEITRTREATERSASDNSEVVDDVRSMQSTVRKAAFSVGALLLVLIGLLVWVLLKVR
ncbi:MAG: hypothetical protein WA294_15475 [Acidobacteriaceae bacterium]